MTRVVSWSTRLTRAARLVALLVLVLAVGAALALLAGFADQGVTRGIIAFELAGDAPSAIAMIGDGVAPLTAAEIRIFPVPPRTAVTE